MPVATTGIKYQSIHIHWIVISIQPVDVRRGVRVLTTGVTINVHCWEFPFSSCIVQGSYPEGAVDGLGMILIDTERFSMLPEI